MKKMLMAVLACAMMALVGCGVNQKDPEAVAKAYAKAQLAGDAKTVMKLTHTPEEMKSVSEKEAEEMEKAAKKGAAEAKIDNVKIKSVSIKKKEDNTATVDVVYESDKGLTTLPLSLKNIEGKWYVKGVDFDFDL